MANPLWANNIAALGSAGTGRVSGTVDHAIAANGKRTYITFQNLGTVDIYYREDSTAPTAANAHHVISKAPTDSDGMGGFFTVQGVIGAMKLGAASSFKVQIMEYEKQ